MQSYKENIWHRLKITEGHLNAIVFMIEHDEYCIRISQQIKAVIGALKKVDEIVLEKYLKESFYNKRKTVNFERQLSQTLKIMYERS